MLKRLSVWVGFTTPGGDNTLKRGKIMRLKKIYQQKLEAQLDEWTADIDKMKAKADKVEADAQLEYYERIESLRRKQQAAQEKLQELSDASEDAWEDLKSGIELAWESLGEAVKSAKSRLK